MKYSEIIRRVRSTIGDSAVLVVTDDGLIDWINDAVRECAIENNLLQKSATTNTVVGQTEYDMSVFAADILKLHSIHVNGEKIKVLTYAQFEELAQGAPGAETVGNAQPWQCYIWGNKLTLSPAPSSVVPLKINYIYDPEDSDGLNLDTTEPPIPRSYHLRIVTYCIAQAALQDDDNVKYTNFMNQFRTGVIDLANKSDTEDDVYPSMTVSSRDMGEYPGLEY